jgi:acetyltransferase-like isoleucine patch superfamily enzyme
MKWLFTTILQVVFSLALYAMGVVLIGLSVFPGALLVIKVFNGTAAFSLPLRALPVCLAVAAAYFIYGLVLIFLVGGVRTVLNLNLKEGEYPIPSFGAFKWAFVNSLFLVVSVTFMDFILLTPFCNLLYRLMGVKMGKNVQINSKNVADISLLEIGDRSVIGGNATVICHSFERSRLKLKKVKIGKDVVIGLNSVILPGVEIGDRALIAAGAVLLKDTKVGHGELFYGVPAESARDRHKEAK